MILTQFWAKPPHGSSGIRVIKTIGNIRIYHPRVFRVRSGPNQSYSPGCDWESISKPSTGRLTEEQLEAK